MAMAVSKRAFIWGLAVLGSLSPSCALLELPSHYPLLCLSVMAVRLVNRLGPMVYKALCFGFSTVEVSRKSERWIFFFLLPDDEVYLSERAPTDPGQSGNLDERYAI